MQTDLLKKTVQKGTHKHLESQISFNEFVKNLKTGFMSITVLWWRLFWLLTHQQNSEHYGWFHNDRGMHTHLHNTTIKSM